MKINDLILKTEKIDWQNIKDLQPVNLKNNYHSDKTKNSIIKNGFARAIYVWQDSKGDIYTVDGHLRADILRELKNDGYDIPDQLNCTFLDLPNKKTAIKYLLQVFNQKTNPINQESMEIWLDDNEIVLEDMDIELDELHIELNDELEVEEEQEEVKEDEVPEVKHTFVVKGDLFELIDEEQGLNHRVLCGDSLNETDTSNLMNGELATLAHNDPPYGMKKEKDGVKNDNLNYDDLLEFNKDWINLQFTYLKDNGSWYCWGIDEPLMDIYSHILKPLIKTQKATFRNLITWNRGCSAGPSGSPIGSDKMRCYPPADEKCLFVMCGVQGFNNNADNYFEGWNSIVEYLKAEKEKAGLTIKDCKRIAGHSENSGCHWFDKSQWMMPTEETYNSWREHCKVNNNDAFKKEYDELKKEYYSTRAYFNNTHDNMTNVWNIERTSQQEREDVGKHATPKPLKLCDRVIKSSSREKDLVIDFFLGSGSTLIACQQTKRKCYGIELDEHYTAVCVLRWKNYMEKEGKKYSIKRNGEQFNLND
jgi:DNA modification methylase